MLLLVDAGNTRIKWAVTEGQDPNVLGAWTAFGMVPWADIDSLVDAWQRWKVSRVVLSHVASRELRVRLEQVLLRVLGLTPVPVEWFRSAAVLSGIRNGYKNPEQLGCDRFATAIGAHALYPRHHLLIATCGTATTIDLVTADGVFAGGMILPGLGVMAKSLAANTANLPQVPEAIKVPSVFADNTADAIISGCVTAQAGAIERAAACARQQYGEVRCILSGGAASLIAPYLSISYEEIDNLVLTGLQVAAQRTDMSCSNFSL